MKQYVASHLKDMNRQVVYQFIKERETTSKAEISRMTGISAPTVIKIVNFLESKGMVLDLGGGENAIGRKPQMLALNTELMYAAAFFLEGDFLSMGIIDITGRIVHKKSMKVKSDFDYIMTLISELLVEQLLKEADIPEEKLFGIGIALPVIYDQKRNTISGAPLVEETDELDITETVDKLAKKYQVMVTVENDVNSQALGAFNVSGCHAKDDLILISVGTGLGAGFILDGKLRRGAHNMCGEIGYMSFTEDYISDRKNPGWFELGIGYKKIQEKFGIQLMDTAIELPQGIKTQVIEYAASPLALCINNISLMLDCDRVVLGGKLVEILGQPLVDKVNEHLHQRCITGIQAQIQANADIGLIGMASLVTDKKVFDVLTCDEE